MSRINLTLILLLFAGCISATTYTETFKGLNSTTAQDGSHTFDLGEWTFKGMSYGSSALKFNASGAYVISPKLDNITKLSFTYRSGGSNKEMTVSYSTDGTSWEDIDRFTISSSSSSFSTWSKTVELGDKTGIQFRILATSSNCYIKVFTASDDVQSGGNEDYTDDPAYKTEGIWKPTTPFPTAQKTIYISTAGNDETGDGSAEKPWYNIAKAYENADPGTHIICRGGKYHINRYGTDGKLTVRMNKVATADKPIVIRCHDGELPVFDFEQQLLDCSRDRSKVGDRGITITGDYHVLYGIHIMHAADNGIKLEGNHNRIERCEFSYNLDTGIQLGFGHDFSASGFGSKNDGSYCAYNDIIDCDSHHNCDFDMNYGSDADGFACKMHNGKGNRFIRCRAWRNGDDAWDLFETDYDVILAECWAWESGKAADHLWVKDYFDGSMSFSGNGNGIKLGGNGTGGSSQGIHYAFNCIAFGCDKSGSVKGFDCNHHKGGHVLVGCLGFDNGYDYMFESGGSAENTWFYNNICLGRQEICVGTDDYNAIVNPPSKNGWTSHLVSDFSKDDFQSLDETDALAPRSIDGSFPRRFGRLKRNSALIDAGIQESSIGATVVTATYASLLADFPFLRQEATGSGRDLGPYEFKEYIETGVNEVKNSVESLETDNVLYNMSGQRVQTGYKGLVIKGRKKFVIK
ncbi:MAG: hypothetical protein ACI4BA_02230 [Prevotella sp.]